MRKIKQLNESEVISAICYGLKVVRVNIDKMVACDLASKSVKVIRNDLDNANYIYFTVEEEELKNE
jgi:hypothetical protein|nr:MAG TPA: hypothetical protein [Caudoviricetes sp.]